MDQNLSPGSAGSHAATPVAQTARLKLSAAGIWTIHYSEPNANTERGWRSRTISCRTTDRAQALQELNQFIRNEAVLTQQHRIDRMTIAELIAFYVNNHALKKTETAWLSLKPVQAGLGHLSPAQLTPDVINAYRRTRKVKDGTMRRELGALTAALNYCQGHNLITLKPKIDLPPSSPARVLYMTEAQELTFWEAAMAWDNRRLKLFVALALETAARAEAIMELTWDRIDFGKLLIDFQVPGRAIVKKRRAVVPISDRLLPVLQWGAQYQKPTALVIGGSALRKTWNSFTRSIDMEWVTPHVCRHTWATMAAHDGVSLLQIAQILGDTEETVARNYVHFQPDRLRHVVNRRKYPS